MIECRGVSFSYDGAVSALDGVDLNIEDGSFSASSVAMGRASRRLPSI